MALEFPSNPTNGQVFDDYFWDASIGAWRGIGSPNNLGVQVAALQTGYRLVQTLYFTSSGTFTKASYPWLRAIRVKCQAAGGGGGGADSTPIGAATIGRSAGGGAYAESFITNIAALDASITVTRGAGGAGGVGGAGGTNGGNSSFGSIVSASGGILGGGPGISGVPGTISGAIAQPNGTGDIVIPGSGAEPRYAVATGNVSNARGGDSFMGAGGDSTTVFSTINGANGSNGYLYGGGGSGAYNSGNTGLNRTGGAGADGIVIVELYA
jgi:hypothetical protein